jgi:hypothetical protein
MLRLLVSRRGSWSCFNTEFNSNFYFLEVNSHWFLIFFIMIQKKIKIKAKSRYLS